MTCTEVACSGQVLEDSYCDTCGAKSGGVTPVSTNAPSTTGVGSNCSQSGCGGVLSNDGYCDTCGLASAGTVLPAGSQEQVQPVSPPPAAGERAGSPCSQGACTGTISSDGYCDTCGMVSSSPAPAINSGQTVHSFGAAIAPTTSTRLAASGTVTAPSRSTTSSIRTGSSAGLGAGLVSIAPVPSGDPAKAVLTDAEILAELGEVSEEERICSKCGKPVGRSRGAQPGRVKGFCGHCRAAFDFVTNEPSLKAGEIVAGQYEILGPVAHGGLGWIYLGRDRAVSNRWVVLKGLLNEDDPDAVAAAVAERQFLAQIDHANIVNIYNFVTHRSAGYIVMEMVDGVSLHAKLKERRKNNGGSHDPLPPQEALAYILGILPAFGYLHEQGLVFNDFKPGNVMVVGDDVKLIDLGAVMQMDDPDAAIFGSVGFQAPEMASLGPSIASDLYTIGRTLAVLMITFIFHKGRYLDGLPTPAEEPLFAKHESLYRFLLRATAKHPDDRFQSAEEMAEQLTGVLREIAALGDGQPRQYTSSNFEVDQLADLLVSGVKDIDAKEADWRVLPGTRIDASDQSAAFLASLPEANSAKAVKAIATAVENGRVPPSHEVMMHLVKEVAALTEVEGQHEMALMHGTRHLVSSRPLSGLPQILLQKLEKDNPWDWRIYWYRAIVALKEGRPVEAADGFSRVWTELPGETAPKMALALAAEQAGDHQRAAQLFDLVSRTDSSFVSASFGLARCQWELGNSNAVADALNRVPVSSAAHYDAQVAIAQARINGGPSGQPSLPELREASSILGRLQIDASERASLAADIYERALVGVQSGQMNPDEGSLLDANLDKESLRAKLEETYREKARLSNDEDERVRLIDAANSVRAKTVV